MDEIGPRLTEVLCTAWGAPFSTKSDTARLYADEIAEAACRGLLTVRATTGEWGRVWRITPLGVTMIFPDASLPSRENLPLDLLPPNRALPY